MVVFALVPREDTSDSSEADSDIEAEEEVERTETEKANRKDENPEEKNATAQVISTDPKTPKEKREETQDFETSLADLD